MIVCLFCDILQTLFMIVFFAAFHEFVTIVKEKVKQRLSRVYQPANIDGEVPLTDLHEQEGTMI